MARLWLLWTAWYPVSARSLAAASVKTIWRLDVYKRQIKQIAEPYGMELLPEIHECYREKIYEKISEQGYVTYDFFLPGLIIDALESGNGEHLAGWAQELIDKNIRTVNMLGCHDGIPLLDLKGILAEDRIQKLIDIIVSRGGYVKDLHGQKNIYYQVNATYFSALGEDERKMLLSLIHIFNSAE